MRLFDLTGKVAIVTGSSRGIGKATAVELARHGCRVVISSRKQDACEAVAAEIAAEHGDSRAIAIAASLSEKAQLEALVAETRRAFGRIDILVCNAATNPHFGPLGGISDEQFRKVLDNNVLANHWLAQLIVPDLLERGEGVIVIVSSAGGFRGSAEIGAYNISKAADMQLARNLAVELGPRGIRVNCVAPGLIRTEFARALWDDPERERAFNARLPLRRLGEAAEIAGAIVFLVSPASSYLTGQALVVDGGLLA